MQSRDEILIKIGELEAQKHVMLSLKAAKPSKKLIDKFRELDQSLATSNSNLSDFANDTEQLRQQCLISRIQAKVDNTNGDTSECQKYAEATGNAEHSVGSNTELFACVKDLDFQVNSFDKKQKALNETVTLINNQIDVLQERLALKSVKMTHLAREALHVADTQDQLDSNWLSFSFSSSHKEVETSQSSRQSSFSVSVDVSARMWGVSSSYSSSKSESRFSNRMNSADTLVEGQLLRVSIQRPWFRPSLFKSHQYEIRVCLLYVHVCIHGCMCLCVTVCFTVTMYFSFSFRTTKRLKSLLDQITRSSIFRVRLQVMNTCFLSMLLGCSCQEMSLLSTKALMLLQLDMLCTGHRSSV